jgi:recombination protein RecA
MSQFDDLCKALDKEIGANDEEQVVSDWLDTGFHELNEILSGDRNGGFGFGRIYEVYGPESCGKTALATKAMIEAQRRGGAAIFIDYERSFDLEMAMNMGLSDQRPFWIYSRPVTWEQGNTIAMKAAKLLRESGKIDPKAPIVVVEDSIAAAIPKSMLYDAKGNRKELDDLTMNDTTALARVTSTTLKMIHQLASELNVIVIYLNQIREKPGVLHGDPTTTPGGRAMRFYASGRLALGRTLLMGKNEDTGDKQLTAQTISIKAVKTKHTRPFGTTELSLKFNDDGSAYFDEIEALIDYLVKRKVLTLSGSRMQWDGKSLFKSQVIKLLSEDSTGKEQLLKLLPEEDA